MHIGILTLDFHLEGCSSLKEKRQRLGGLRERFGRLAHMAVCESDRADVLQSAQWSFVAVASSRPVVERALGEVESFAAENLDARICGREVEYA